MSASICFGGSFHGSPIHCFACLSLRGCSRCCGGGAFTWFPHHQISLHFLMQRRAEVCAIERKHAGLVQLDVEGFRFARVHHHVDIVFDQPESVNHVACLLDVRLVHC